VINSAGTHRACDKDHNVPVHAAARNAIETCGNVVDFKKE